MFISNSTVIALISSFHLFLTTIPISLQKKRPDLPFTPFQNLIHCLSWFSGYFSSLQASLLESYRHPLKPTTILYPSFIPFRSFHNVVNPSTFLLCLPRSFNKTAHLYSFASILQHLQIPSTTFFSLIAFCHALLFIYFFINILLILPSWVYFCVSVLHCLLCHALSLFSFRTSFLHRTLASPSCPDQD